jgi:hypothetical protein
VELTRRYSNHADLHERLAQAAQRALSTNQDQEVPDACIVRGRATGVWRVHDRLSERDVIEIIEQFRAGKPKHSLADQFGISLSSVKLLLRQRGVRREEPS